MKEHKVSVIIPIYNVEKVLDRCIESVIKQTYKNIEIILVNDGSTDHSKEVCEEYVAKDGRCQLISIENAGVGNARNVGLDASSGDYIVYIDADDIIAEEYVEILLACAVNNDLSIVSCGLITMPENEVKKYWKYKKPILHMVSVIDEYDYSAEYARRNVCGVIIKRELMLNTKFDTDLFVGEDMYFFSKLLIQCERVGYIESELYGYIIYSKSATRGRYDKKKLTVVKAFERMLIILEPFPTLKKKCNALFALECAEAIKWICYYGLDKKEYEYDKLSKIARKYFWNVICSQKSFKIKVLFMWQLLLPNIFNMFFRMKQEKKGGSI